MRLYLRSCLQAAGAVHIHEATNGHEALLLARMLLPDVILSDVVMPGLDGFALRRALRADPTTAAIPLLLVSGLAQHAAPGSGVLSKPFNAAQLRASLDHLLPPPPAS